MPFDHLGIGLAPIPSDIYFSWIVPEKPRFRAVGGPKEVHDLTARIEAY